jgi:hypothetical protein
LNLGVLLARTSDFVSGPAKMQNSSDFWAEDVAVLYFPKNLHTPNPAALSVCRGSPKIALQHYRSCFGTLNVYADLKPDNLFLPLGTVLISEPFGNGVIVLLVVLGRVIR